MKALKEHIEQIKQLCDIYHIRSLFTLGSVVSDKLKQESDIDMIVDIDNKDALDYSDNYFALKFQLENILKRPVNLLEDKALKKQTYNLLIGFNLLPWNQNVSKNLQG